MKLRDLVETNVIPFRRFDPEETESLLIATYEWITDGTSNGMSRDEIVRRILDELKDLPKADVNVVIKELQDDLEQTMRNPTGEKALLHHEVMIIPLVIKSLQTKTIASSRSTDYLDKQ